MEIYFVRHGETSGNVGKRHQPEHTRLTFKGEAQAMAVGQQLKYVRPTHFYTSTQVRAVETASLMSELFDMVPETNELFMELIRPGIIHGKKHRSLASLWYIVRWFQGHRGGAEEVGESREQFYYRLQHAKVLLESLPHDARVIVVSHSVFINLFIDFVRHGESGGLFRGALTFLKIILMPNTAVTRLIFDKDSGWRVVV